MNLKTLDNTKNPLFVVSSSQALETFYQKASKHIAGIVYICYSFSKKPVNAN